MVLQTGACCGPISASDTTNPNQFPFSGSFPPEGHIFYRDDYGQLYEVTWETINFGEDFLLDFTVVTKQPYVWGEVDEGFIANRVVFRRGICTTWRFIIGPHEDGYEIVAEGMSQVICVFQSTFICEEQPGDEFKHHLDSYVCDEIENIVTCGTRFADPTNANDNHVFFQLVSLTGVVTPVPGSQPFQFVNVWEQNDDLDAVCSPISQSPSLSLSPSPSLSPSLSLSPSPSISLSASLSLSPSPSLSASQSLSLSPSPSLSLSASLSPSPSISLSVSLSLSPSLSLSISTSPSISASVSVSPSPSETP